MSSLDKAVETQLNNIQKKTGKSLNELAEVARSTGLTKHAEIRSMFQREYGLGYGDANALAHAILKSDGERAAERKSSDEVLDEIYSGPKVALHRKKQFAMLGPKTNTRFEVGLNAKDLERNARLLEQPKGSMCNYIVKVTEAGEVDAELISWVKSAFVSAGYYAPTTPLSNARFYAHSPN